MQIFCDGLDLSDAVLTVSKAISSRTTNPVIEGIKLVAEDETLTLIATDMDLCIEKKIKAEVHREGEIVVPGKFFSDFIKKLTNEKIELYLLDNRQLRIRYGENESLIQCFDTVEFPDFKKIDTSDFFALTQKDLKNLINKSIFAVAVDDSRPILKGCLFEIEENKVTSVALDGYRLAKVEEPLKQTTLTGNIIIPARSLAEISKLLDDSEDIINIYVQKNFVMIDLNATKIISRLFEGEFINYKQIISKTFETRITVNKSQFENTLERASLLSKIGQNNLVKFEIKENTLCVTSNSEIGNIKENINMTLNGKDLVIAFNARYFNECFRVINAEYIEVGFNSPSNPCVITSVDNKEFLYLILPVRILA